MKTLEINIFGTGSIIEVIEKHMKLLSILMNSAWFPKDDSLIIKMTHSLELSEYSWLVQFACYNPNHKEEIVPCLITIVANANESKTKYEFCPVHIMFSAEAGSYEVKVFDTENIMGHLVHKVKPSFDCYLDFHSEPVSAKIIFKFFIIYKNEFGKILVTAEMPFYVDYLIRGTDNMRWLPANDKSLIYSM